jgi:hypothetical protein
MRALSVTATGFIIAIALTAPVTARAQSPSAGEAEREHAYVDMLRREDAAAADRYVALRDARAQALADLRKAEAQYNGAGPGLQAIFLRSVREARKKYAETSLALLEFFDVRDRALINRYEDEVRKIRGLLDERGRTRGEIEKLLAP